MRRRKKGLRKNLNKKGGLRAHPTKLAFGGNPQAGLGANKNGFVGQFRDEIRDYGRDTNDCWAW